MYMHHGYIFIIARMFCYTTYADPTDVIVLYPRHFVFTYIPSLSVGARICAFI